MNYYEVLQVSPTASLAVIQMAYQALQNQYQVEALQGDKSAEMKMQQLEEAYRILSSPVLRKKYDHMLQLEENQTLQPAQGSLLKRQTMVPKKRVSPKLLAILTVLAIVIMTVLVFTLRTGWGRTSNGDKVYYVRGSRVEGWKTIDGDSYYFSSDGVMQTGLVRISGNNYYFDTNGVMQTGWQMINGKTHCFDQTGRGRNGWVTPSDYGRYYFQNGVAVTGKQTIDGYNYYFHTDGSMAMSEVNIENQIYVFNHEGHFQYKKKAESNIRTRSSEDKVRLGNVSGGLSKHGYQILENPIEECSALTVSLTVTEVVYGNCDGKWQVHIRKPDGTWERLGFFTVTKGKGKFKIESQNPISFNAIVCSFYGGSNYSLYSSTVLEEVWYYDHCFY